MASFKNLSINIGLFPETLTASSIYFPIVIRPSYVLGGRAMEIIHEPKQLEEYIEEA